MIEIRLDAIASSINFIGGIILAVDALTVRRRTKMKRGGQKLLEGLQKIGEEGQIQSPGGNKVAEPAGIQDPDGNLIGSVEALEDWADRLTTRKARTGFICLVVGFGLDLISKALCNPLFFSK
jgi:hypothetical protein